MGREFGLITPFTSMTNVELLRRVCRDGVPPEALHETLMRMGDFSLAGGSSARQALLTIEELTKSIRKYRELGNVEMVASLAELTDRVLERVELVKKC